jgi:hypothetical protein
MIAHVEFEIRRIQDDFNSIPLHTTLDNTLPRFEGLSGIVESLRMSIENEA